MQRSKKRSVIIAFAFVLFAQIACANTPQTHVFELNEQKINILSDIEYQQIETDIHRITHLSTGWNKTHADVFNMGFSPHSYWLKAQLNNVTRNEEWFLTLDNTRLDFVDFYLVTNENIQQLHSGDHRPISGQYSSSPTFTFYLAKQQTAQLYIRVQSSAQVTFTPKIRSSLVYGKYLAEIKQIHIFYLLIMLIFIGFQLLTHQKIICPINLYYTAGLFFAFAYKLFYYGEGNLLFWPDNVVLKNRSFFAFAMLSFIYFTLFLQKYLRSSNASSTLHSMLNVYLVSAVICAVIMMLPVTNMVRVVLVLFAAFSIALLTIIGTIHTLKQKNYWALGLAIPLFITTLSLFIYGFTFIGVLPSTPFTSRLILWAIPLDALLISLSLAFRHSALRRERDELIEKLRYMPASEADKNGSITQVPSTAPSAQVIYDNRLSNINTSVTIVKLIKYLDQNQAFLKPGLTLEEVALKLEIRADQLSTLINKELNTSFPTLINIKRLLVAAEKLKKNPNSSILTIALECGFGSKSSFNRLFKEYFDTTPSVYRKQNGLNRTL